MDNISRILTQYLPKDLIMCEAFMNLLLSQHVTRPQDNNPQSIIDFVDLVNARAPNIPEQSTGHRTYFQKQLKKMLMDTRMIAFIRVMKIIQKITIARELSKNHLINYVERLKFRPEGTISIYTTARALHGLLDPINIGLFASLTEKQKYLLRMLSKDQIDVLLNSNPEEINLSIRFALLTDKQRTLIALVTSQQKSVLEKIGPARIDLLMGLNSNLHHEIFKLRKLMKHKNADINDLSHFIRSLTEVEYNTLRILIHQNGNSIDSATTDIILKMEALSNTERSEMMNFDMLKNMDGEELDVLAGLIERIQEQQLSFKEIFDTARRLSEKQLELILSLNEEGIKSISRMISSGQFHEMTKLDKRERSKIIRDQGLKHEEEVALLRLDDDQRNVLAKIYVLGEDGLRMISDLTWPQFALVLKLSEQPNEPRVRLNLTQRVLLKKINHMKLADPNKLLKLPRNELVNLSSIIRLDNPVLLSLSHTGLAVLRAMTALNREQLSIVSKLSNDKMITLVRNSNINMQTIEKLDGLKEEEGRFLINLNLEQRNTIRLFGRGDARSTRLFNNEQLEILQNLSTAGQDLLRDIIRLNDEEMIEVEGGNEVGKNYLDELSETESKIIISLSDAEIIELTNISIPSVEETLPIKIWQIFHNVGSTREEYMRKVLFRDIAPMLKTVEKYSHEIRLSYIELLAGAVIAAQTKNHRVNIVNEIAELVRSNCDDRSVLWFYLHIFEFSIKDNFQEEYVSHVIEKIREHGNIVVEPERIFYFTNSNEVSIFRQFLLSTIDWDVNIFHRITRKTLLELQGAEMIDLLQQILHKEDTFSNEEVGKTLRRLFKEDEYILTRKYYFELGIGDESLDQITIMSKLLVKILKKPDIKEFFNFPVTRNFLLNSRFIDEHRDTRDILENEEFNMPNLLEFSLYYTAGDPFPLLEKMKNSDLLELFYKHPLALLKLCLRGSRSDLLGLFSKRAGNEGMGELVRANSVELVTSIMEKQDEPGTLEFTLKRYLRSHHLSNWLGKIDPTMKLYLDVVSAYIVNAKKYLSPEMFDQMVENFVQRHVTKNQLLEMGQSHGSSDSSTVVGCGQAMVKRDLHLRCVDSEKEEEKAEVLNIEWWQQKNFGKKIEGAASAAGFAYTVFLVGKHVANRDLKGLGYDTLNLWALPQLGKKISQKIMNLGGKYESRLIKSSAPIIGRAVGNFAAFFGLVEAINARKNATDPVDENIADLNIATNSIFIAADLPGVVAETMAVWGLETALLETIAGPIGMGISVITLIVSDFVESGFEVEKLGEKIKLTTGEKSEFYWDYFLDRKLPEYITEDIELRGIYEKYLSGIIGQFDNDYDKMGIGLPSLLITTQEYAVNAKHRTKRQFSEIWGTGSWWWRHACYAASRVIDSRLDYTTKATITEHAFHQAQTHTLSRLILNEIKDYNLICGPSADNVKVDVVNHTFVSPLPSGTCDPYDEPDYSKELSRTIEKRYIPELDVDHCQHMTFFEKRNSSSSKPMLFYVEQNLEMTLPNAESFDIFFQGETISIHDRGATNTSHQPAQSRYHLTSDLRACEIYKEGLNLFYVNGSQLICDLGIAPRQINVALVKENFQDGPNIHSIMGSDGADRIRVSYANFVDGKGGNDTIVAKNFTTVKAYFGDVIHGTSMVLLPLNLSQIDEIIDDGLFTVRTEDRFISLDRTTLLKTADGFLVTPTKICNNTRQVTHLHVLKNLQTNVPFEIELTELRKITNQNFNLVKQFSSTYYDMIISDRGNNVFYTDKDFHNFYWEGRYDSKNLYMFDDVPSNITISKANGILNFQQAKKKMSGTKIKETEDKEIQICNGVSRVTLLPNYHDIKVTFDGNEFYKLQNGVLKRDYCSHVLEMKGTILVNGTDLENHHNCFRFLSKELSFIKVNDDLTLSSGRQILTIINYYSIVHKNLDLSVRLNHYLIKPNEFQFRADNPKSLRVYEVDSTGLQLFHNQPVNYDRIGLIVMKNRSIRNCDMKIFHPNLYIVHNNATLVEIVNWSTHSPTREVTFVFDDCIIDNTKNSDNILEEFEEKKRSLSSRNSRSIPEEHFHMGSNSAGKQSWWTQLSINEKLNATPKLDVNFHIGNNIGLALFLLQKFIDRKYPLPQLHSITNEETLGLAFEITGKFRCILKKITKKFHLDTEKVDWVEIFSQVRNLIRNENYSKLAEVFYLSSVSIDPGNKRFLTELKRKVERILIDLKWIY